MKVHIIERIPVPQEYARLRQAVSASIYASEVVKKGLSGSLHGFSLCPTGPLGCGMPIFLAGHPPARLNQG